MRKYVSSLSPERLFYFHYVKELICRRTSSSSRSVIAITVLLVLLLPVHRSFATPQERGITAANRSAELNEEGFRAAQAQNPKRAQQLFEQALATDERNLSAVLNLSGVLLSTGKTDRAITLLARYASKSPDDPRLLARYGDALFAGERVEDARVWYERAYKQAPTLPNLAAKLGTVYSLLHRLPDAERVLIAATTNNPKDSQSLANLASVYLALGKPDEAIAAAKLALQVSSSPAVYVTLGSAYEAKQELAGALIAFERARTLGDTREELAKKIEGLKKAVNT